MQWFCPDACVAIDPVSANLIGSWARFQSRAASRAFVNSVNLRNHSHRPTCRHKGVLFATLSHYRNHRCKIPFLLFSFFYKKSFLTLFIFWTFFILKMPKFLILVNLLNSYIKRLINDEFNMAAIGNSLMKSHNPQTLSCILY